MTDDDLEIDFSELHDLTYRCLDGCALCCLCQPELLEDEERTFRGDPDLSAGLAERHISPDVRGAAIRLQGAHGACHFLRGRKCAIYQRRPHYCRAFPLSVYAGWRIQLNVNLSCRGVGLPGEDLAEAGRHLLDRCGRRHLSDELRDAQKVFSDFSNNMRDAKVSQSVASVRASAAALAEEMTDELGLSRLLTYAESARTRQNSPPQEIARRARGTDPEADVHDLAVSIGTELFDLADLSYLPVYVDENMVWKVFRLEDGEIIGYRLDEDGRTTQVSRTAPQDVTLLPLSGDGREAMAGYLRTVNERDCFMGHAAHLLDLEGYSYNFAQAYLGALANAAADLWWRASFLAGLAGFRTLDCKAVKEGVVFFDMDLLDQQTIGAFL